MMKIGESVCRIVFGGIFLTAALVVYLLTESPYGFVAAVIAINGVLCCVTGILNIVKINKEKEELRLENERVEAEKMALYNKIMPEVEKCRTLYDGEIAKYEGRVDMRGYVMINDIWFEYRKVLCDGEDLLFMKDCRIDSVCSGGLDEMSRFEWNKYGFDDDIVFRCRVYDIVFFKHADDANYRNQTNYGRSSAVSGKVILRVNNDQVVFTQEAYNIFMSLVPDKEFDYIVATKNMTI